MIKAVIFLGNPGQQYSETRHNAGWMVAEASSNIFAFNWQKKFKGNFCQKNISGSKIYFLKPETFMNKSGESVLALAQFFKVQPEEMLVVHDEIELNFGVVSFKQGGGLAGHNGLRSISNVLGTKHFYRFRIGVGRPSRGDVSSYVLSKFSADEQIVLPTVVDKSAELLASCLKQGIDPFLNEYAKHKLL